MTEITIERFRELQKNLPNLKIAVLGDLMVDRYFWGRVTRISPEAPVPIVDITDEAIRLGGAANVANNIGALGAVPVLIGVVGDDALGDDFRGLLTLLDFPTEGIIADPDRPTSVKTRIIADNQQLVRTDHENRAGISRQVEEQILTILDRVLPTVDALILEDYNKGVLTPTLITETIRRARQNSIIVTVDPKEINFNAYTNVTVFKPNQREAEAALGYSLDTEEAVERGVCELQDILQCDHVLITRGKKGMVLRQNNDPVYSLPTRAQQVHDVSGAGDTVISVLTTFLAAGASAMEAASIANRAAGIVVADVGVVPIRIAELAQAHGVE